MKIIFKTEPVKYVHTKWGDFIYYKVRQHLEFLSDRDGELAFGDEDSDMEQWLVDTKTIEFSYYDEKWGSVYIQGKNWKKNYNKITEHERILDKLIGE